MKPLTQTIPAPVSSVVKGASGCPPQHHKLSGWYREVLIDTKSGTLRYWPKTTTE